jgi:hypothetical protein
VRLARARKQTTAQRRTWKLGIGRLNTASS